MLTAEERYRLIEEASELSDRWDSQGVEELLSPLFPEYLVAEPELGHLLSLALYRAGRQREATEWIRQLTGACQNHSDRLLGRHLLLKGSLYVEQGELDKGNSLFGRAAAIAGQIRDQLQWALATMNMGVVSVIRCEWQPGLAAFKRAVAMYTQLGRSTEVAVCTHNIGMVYREMGELSTAADVFDCAIQQYASLPNVQELCSTESERALLFLACGDLNLSQAAALRALDFAIAKNNLRHEGEVLRVLGIVRRAQGLYADAKAHLERAMMLARQTNTAMLEAEVNQELAILAHVQRDFSTANARARLANACFKRLGAEKRAERIEEMAAQA